MATKVEIYAKYRNAGSVDLYLLNKDAEALGIRVYTFGAVSANKEVLKIEALRPEEEEVVKKKVMYAAQLYREKGLHRVADYIERCKDLVLIAAAEAKALFGKEIRETPMSRNELGVAILMPQFVRYVASPSDEYPAYSEYQLNKWEIALRDPNEDTPPEVYLLGGSGEREFWRPPRVEGQRFVAVFLGILKYEYPAKGVWLTQIWLTNENTHTPPLEVGPEHYVPEFVSNNIAVYFYRIPVTIVSPERAGIKLAVVATAAESPAEMPLLGFVIYEYEAFRTLKVVK